METFTELKDFVDNPEFQAQRQRALNGLDMNTIDLPIIDIIRDFKKLSCCFTIQSCYGHFLRTFRNDSHNIEPVEDESRIDQVEYRIAYLALCIEDNEQGRTLYKDLERIRAIAPPFIQFGCAEWFWERQVNSYVLQVEPEEHKTKDRIKISYQHALQIERVRNQFFGEIEEIVREKIHKE